MFLKLNFFKKKYLLLIAIAFIFLSYSFNPLLYAQDVTSEKQNEIYSYIDNGLVHLHNADFEEAEIAFDKAIKSDNKIPIGYFYKGMVCWNRILTEPKNSSDNIRDCFSESISIAEKCLETDCWERAETMLYLGNAYGYKAMNDFINKEWWSAFWNIKKGKKYLTNTLKINPYEYDTYVGIGMYEYYLDKLPKIAKFFSFFMALTGDREKGLQMFIECIEKGRFSKTEAKMGLANIYLYFEKDYENALPLVLSLKEEYPRNPKFRYLSGSAYSKLKKWDEALEITDKMEEEIKTGKPNFTKEWLAKGYYLRGEIYREKEMYQESVGNYNKALNSYNVKGTWVEPWSHMRIGIIYDILGKRELAKKQYNEVLKIRETSDEHIYLYQYAEKYLKVPYEKNDPDKLD